jgi:hypothetical protein
LQRHPELRDLLFAQVWPAGALLPGVVGQACCSSSVTADMAHPVPLHHRGCQQGWEVNLVHELSNSCGGMPKWLVMRRGRFAGLPLCIGLALATTSCGAHVDGEQWARVIVTNNTAEKVTLDVHPARDLSPGQKTELHVDSNSNPQALRLRNTSGRILGCLDFRFRTTSSETFSFNISDFAACDENVPLF